MGLCRIYLILALSVGTSLRARGDAFDSWQLVPSGTNGSIDVIACGNGAFVAAFYNGSTQYYSNPGELMVSTNGVTWISPSFSPSIEHTYFSSVLFQNGEFVASGLQTAFNSGVIYVSTNGLVWNQGNYYDEQINGVAYGNGFYVTVGYDYDDEIHPDSGTSYNSTNGLDWTYHATGTTNFLTGVAYGNGKFFAVGYPNVGGPTNANIMWSITGAIWHLIPSSFVGPLLGISFVNGRFYTTEEVFHYGIPPSFYQYTSTDGTNWTLLTTPPPTMFIPTGPSTPANGIYVAVGANGTVLTSLDATNWISRNTGFTNDLSAVAVGPSNVWIGGTDGALFRSGNTFPSLTAINLPGTAGFQLSVSGGIGPGYRLEDSTDLTHWSTLYTFTNIEASPLFLDLSPTNYSRRFYRAVWP